MAQSKLDTRNWIRDAEYFGNERLTQVVMSDGTIGYYYVPYIPWNIVDRTDIWADDGGAIYERES
jgi:hypothetical protein